jgi:hypothetical protein
MPVMLAKESVEAIKLSLSLGRNVLSAVNDAISASGPALKSPKVRATDICERSKDKVARGDIERVLERFVYPIHALRQNTGLSAEETFLALDEAIRESLPDTSVDLTLWNESKSEILALLENDTLVREAKARALLDARPNRVRKLSVLLDLRPLFNETGDHIFFDVLTHTLCVEFIKDNQASVMYFSLDSDDLEQLGKQVERAKGKTTAVEARSRECDLPLVKVGYDTIGGPRQGLRNE